MTDIHCHILPEIDDGADTAETSLRMARLAAASGVKTICATPHFQCFTEAGCRSQYALIVKRFELLKGMINAEKIPVSLIPGAEILCMPENASFFKAGLIPTLGNTRYILCEFTFDEELSFMEDMLFRVADAGYLPVIAHPERYDAVQENLSSLSRWFDFGYTIQLNKGSILGSFGRRAQSCALRILDAGLAHIVASDAHGTEFRTPHMTELCDFLADRVGFDYLSILTERNPARILNGRETVPV